MKLLNKITFQQVLESKSDKVYYSTRTFWWTDDPADLYTTKPLPQTLLPPGEKSDFGSGLPCDIFGAVLFEERKCKFLADLDRIVKHYGSIEVFMAMHAKNFTPEPGDPVEIFTKKQAFVDAVKAAKHES